MSRARRGWLAAALGTATLALPLWAPTTARADEGLWALLRQGGQVVMIRHATAPGGGDPPGFRVDDCATQRNLDEAGRQESRRIGEAFRTRGIPVARVLSSQWCRCLETARLAFGRAEPWPVLNSYFYDPSWDARFTPEVRRLAGQRPEGGNLILVTHQFNIRAVAGVSPASGETVILTPWRDGTFTLAGRLPVSALRR